MIPGFPDSYKDISRSAQAVLGIATLVCIQNGRGLAPIAVVREALGLSDAEWEATHTELYEAGLMWRTGDDLDQLDQLQTADVHALCMAALAPTNRPKAKDWEALRARVFQMHFGAYDAEPHCIYCYAEDVPLELDHVLPLSRGGSNHPLNLLPACKPCNCSKGSKTWSEWKPRP